MRSMKGLYLVLVALSLWSVQARAATFVIDWLDMSGVNVGDIVPSGSVFNLPGYGDVQVIYTGTLERRRNQTAAAQNGTVISADGDAYPWTTFDGLFQLNNLAAPTTPLTYSVQYTFLNGPVPACELVLGVWGLGRSDQLGSQFISTITVANNGNFLGDWDMPGVNYGPTDFMSGTPIVGSFRLRNSLTPTGNPGDPAFNTDLGVVAIDGDVTTLTLDVTHIGQDGFAFSVGHKSCPCVSPPSTPIAWWSFDETKGPIAADLVGNHAGYYKPPFPDGPTPILGWDGPALSFDGVNDYVSVLHKPELDLLRTPAPGVATIEAVVNTLTWPETIVSKGGISSAGQYAFGINSQGFPSLSLIDAINEVGIEVVGDIAVQDWWTCVAVTLEPLDGDTLVSFFVDGTPAGSSSIGLAPGGAFNNDPLLIANGPGGFFTGGLDEVTLYDRALTSDELRSNCFRKKCKCKKSVYGDIAPCEGNGIIDVDDILAMLGAFVGTDLCP